MTVIGRQPSAGSGPDISAVLADPRAAWRREPPDRKRAYARRHGVDAKDLRDPAQLDRAVETVLGDRDFLPARWLREGAAAADTVGRVTTPAGFGTGFLVTPWLLMTNNHVLTDATMAEQSAVTFRYIADADEAVGGSRKHQLQPARCFVTSPVDELDMTLVAVAPSKDGRPPGDTFGFLPAKAGVGKILIGRPVNVLQHPQGRTEEVAFRNNVLLTVDSETRVTYGTDTEPGSSGSPVLNDDWEVVALHHVGGGMVGDTIIGNEGIRISAIVRHVDSLVKSDLRDAGTDARALLAEFLTVSGILDT
jgi:endonuclease G